MAEHEDKAVRLPHGMVEIGPGHAVRARDVCEVEHDHRSGETLIGLDFSGRQADADSPLPYAEVMRRLRQAQLDELAEPGDPEVVHLLREIFDSIPEDRRQALILQVGRCIDRVIGETRAAQQAMLKDLKVDGYDPRRSAGQAYDPLKSATSAADTTDQLAEG